MYITLQLASEINSKPRSFFSKVISMKQKALSVIILPKSQDVISLRRTDFPSEHTTRM